MFSFAPLPRSLEAAVRDTEHKKLEVRISAVRDLGRYVARGELRASEVLGRVLVSDASAGVRSEAAVALADGCAGGCVELLIAALGDVHPRVRQMALMALGEVAPAGDPRALRAIRSALEDDSPEQRFQALVALHHVAGEDALPKVFEAMGDADPQIRQVAFRIAEERCFDARGGAELSDELRACAHAGLEDEAPGVRLAAAILLARAGDDAGREVIVAAIDAPRPGADLEDEHAAIELAGERGYSEARQGLARRAFGRLLGKDAFAWQALVALARLGDDRARAEILKGLVAWTRDARTLAVAAAGRARLVEARDQIQAMRGRSERADPDAVREALELLVDA